MKYSFLFPYLNRYDQLIKTLESFQIQYPDRKDFEVLLVLDNKNTIRERNRIQELCFYFSDFFDIFAVENSKDVTESSTAYNMAAYYAVGSIFILSNPECIHKTNILKGFDEEFDRNKNLYVVCACESLTPVGEVDMWYQHSLYNNRCLHFCSAISAENYEKIDGFNEEYDNGIAYNDDDFRERVKKINLPFMIRDDLIVSHQYHDRSHQCNQELIEKNKKLFYKLWT